MTLLSLLAASAAPAQTTDNQVERGRYLAVIGGCNDCHTTGYGESGGKTPVDRWLMGDRLGFRGPWGTTYPTNLRLYFQQMDMGRWIESAKRLRTRPPMPWFTINAMTDADLGALYAFIRSLGPAGDPAPSALPPGVQPDGPTVDWPGVGK